MKTPEVPKSQFTPRPTSLAWTILRDAIRAGDTVFDATTGNGHDTVFLAECVGATGRVLAFDIQESAIRSARLKVDQAGFAPRVEFHQCSHARMAEHAAAGSVSAVMFNLGYLPGEDHETTTVASETLAGLHAAAGLLQSGGVLSVICYPGHQAGADEAVAVESWFKSQTDKGWRVAKYQMLGTVKPAPFLVLGGKP
jgi:tRNA1(Val) A37 N6-methylase TrmN6